MTITRINLQQILPHIESGSTILAPNLRVKDAILSQYLNSLAATVAITPNVIPIDVFIKKYWELNARQSLNPCNELQLLTASEEFLLWNEIIEDSLEKIPLLNPDEMANAVAHSYQLARQWLDPEIFKEELKANSSIKDVAVFSQWAEIFQNRCSTLQLISLVDAIATFTQLLRSEKVVSFPDKLILVNFYNPPPLYQNFFAALQNSEELLTVAKETVNNKLSKIKLEFNNKSSETQNCAAWVKEILNNNANAHIGIISSNKALDRTNIQQALRDTLNPDFLFFNHEEQPVFNSTGNSIRLSDNPIIHDALLVLGLGREQYQIVDLIRLLQSPFLSYGETSESEIETQARISLAGFLRHRAHSTISSRELSYLIKNEERTYHCKLLATQLVQIRTEFRKLQATSTAQQWSQQFSRLLDIAGWPGSLNFQNQTSILNQWQKLLIQFSRTSSILPRLDYSSALAKLRLLATQQTMSNKFHSSLPVSFYSVSESIGMEFDHVWLLGFNDQQWPEPVKPSPFIPYATQKAAGIPRSHSEIQFNNGRKLFAQLLASTNFSVHASYCKNDGEQEFRASSFIQEFEFDDSSDIIRSLNQKAAPLRHSIIMETISDTSLPLSKEESLEGGASLITDQSNCPFRAFAKNRLKLEPEPSLETGLSKMARGTALHIALEHLFERINSSDELKTADLDIFTGYASTKAIEHLAKHFRDIMTPQFQLIEKQRIKGLLHKFIEVEKNRPPFNIIVREQPLSQNYENLLLKVRIDRIDRVENDSAILIDYKTGKYTISTHNWMNDRPEDMQLPLYYTMATSNNFEQVNSVTIAHVNAEKIGYSGIAKTESFSPEIKAIGKDKWTDLDWEQITKYWSEKVLQFSNEFNAGECEVNPIDPIKTCTYCGLQSLCRIQELTDSDVLNQDINES